MIIVLDSDKNITELITIGSSASENAVEISDDTDQEIVKNIFSYKYIDGNFVLKDGVDKEKLEELKVAKINALSTECGKQIVDGVDWNGEHYSLSLDDQTNIGNLTLLASAGNPVPYHADGDGGNCRIFAAEDFVAFSTYCQQFKVYQLTYFNQLKGYVNTLTDIDSVLAVNYGTPLTGDYATALTQMTGGFEYTIPEVKDTTDYSTILQDINLDTLVFPTEEESPDENSDVIADEGFTS